jgi:hypothetical protein
LVHEQLAEFEAILKVHFKHRDSGSPYCRLSDQKRAVPSKMGMPIMATRVEQWDYLFCFGIDPGDIWPFVVVAGKARQAKVISMGRPAVFPGDDMVNFKGAAIVRLQNLAVFTTVIGSCPNEFSERAVHVKSMGFGFSICSAAVLKRYASLRMQQVEKVAHTLIGVDRLFLYGR